MYFFKFTSGNEKFLRWTIEGLQVDFVENFNFSVEITNMRVLKSHELIFNHKNSLEWTIEGLYVDFAKNINLGNWAWNCIFEVFAISKT